MSARLEGRSLTHMPDTCSDESISLFPRLIANLLISRTLG